MPKNHNPTPHRPNPQHSAPKTTNPTPTPPTPKERSKRDTKNWKTHWDKHNSKHETYPRHTPNAQSPTPRREPILWAPKPHPSLFQTPIAQNPTPTHCVLGAGSDVLGLGVEAFGSGLGCWLLGAWSGVVVLGPWALEVLGFLGFFVGLGVLGHGYRVLGAECLALGVGAQDPRP